MVEVPGALHGQRWGESMRALRMGALRCPVHARVVPLRGDGKSLPDVCYADAICLLRTFAHLRHRYISQASQNLIVLEACLFCFAADDVIFLNTLTQCPQCPRFGIVRR